MMIAQGITVEISINFGHLFGCIIICGVRDDLYGLIQ